MRCSKYRLCSMILTVFFSINSLYTIAHAQLEKIGIYTGGNQPGHYLQWKGKPILLIGDSVTQGWMESGTNFDQNAYIDALASRDINLLMIWSFIGTNSVGQQADSRIGYDAPEIWPWLGSPDSGNFDLTQLNQGYFDRLKALVSYAQSKGVVVLITVHDGWTKERFNRHPFNSSLGNGPLTDNSQYVELANFGSEMPNIFDPLWNPQQKNQYFQERFCDKLISELNSYSNVIYEMFNEGEWYNDNLRNQHEQHFLAFFRARCDNLLLTETDAISGDDPHNDSKVDVVSLHGNWTGRFAAFQSGFDANPSKPYLLSEPVPGWDGLNLTLDVIRRSMWEVSLAGAGWVNQNDPSFGWDPNASIAAQSALRDQAYDFAGHCARFFNISGVNFSNMKPQGTLSSTGICLTQVGVNYVVYAPNAGTFTVDLTAASGTLNAEWYNPRTGEFTSAGTVAGGGTPSFTAPDSNDWILYIGDRETTSPAPVTGFRIINIE